MPSYLISCRWNIFRRKCIAKNVLNKLSRDECIQTALSYSYILSHSRVPLLVLCFFSDYSLDTINLSSYSLSRNIRMYLCNIFGVNSLFVNPFFEIFYIRPRVTLWWVPRYNVFLISLLNHRTTILLIPVKELKWWRASEVCCIIQKPAFVKSISRKISRYLAEVVWLLLFYIAVYGKKWINMDEMPPESI